MSQNALRPRLADLALVTYLAPLLQGRRVAVAGTTSGEIAQRLRALGAHTVLCFGGVGEDIAVRALTPGAIAAFHGRIDVLLVPDATAVPSLVALLDEARRALGSEGVIAVGAEAPQGPRPMEPTGRDGVTAYHDLYDLCAARFANVRMLGRGPFVGYTLAAFDDASDRVALDTRLIDGDPGRPESFVAVASDSAVALDPIAVVQVPDALLETIRDGGAKALREQLQERDQKLKEVEAASAERWVKIQRFEHGVKELEEENRKAREKVVRATKELEDERKLRQRVELEAQMSRRAPDLPKPPDLTPELQRARDELAAANRRAEQVAAGKDAELASLRAALDDQTAALAAARDDIAERAETVAAQEILIASTQSELASLRAAEVADRGALDEARARIEGLERELDETQATEAELQAELDAARAATPAVDNGVVDGLRAERDALRSSLIRAERRAERAEAAAAEASSGEELAALEARLAACAAELARVSALRDDALTAVRELNRAARRPPPLQAAPPDEAAAELRALRERVRMLEGEAVAFAGQSQQWAWRVDELEAALTYANARIAARAAEAEPPPGADALRAENAAMEARLVQRGLELDGLRAGYDLRVAELEQEVDRLLRALEVVGAQTEAESRAQIDARRRVSDALGAELEGVRFRLREAEAALATGAAVTAAPAPVAVEVRADQALSDLGRTAERLAATEESLRDVRAQLRATESELAATRREQSVLAERVDEAAAQLDERDRREASADAQRREQLVALQDRLTNAELRAQSLRELMAKVRSNVSAILADGRGALVAHDLLQILRDVESTDGG